MPYNPYMFNPRGFDPTQDYGISNPVPRMRQRSIFDRPTTPDDETKRFLSQVNPAPKADFSPQPADDNASEGSRYYDEMMRTSRRGPAVSAYQAALKEQPTDENTNVSTSRKIMGTLAGIAGGFARGPEGGISSANEIIDSPYKTAMRDYAVKMKNLGESAKLEEDDQTSQLNAMKSARDFGLRFDEYKSKLSKEARDAILEGRRVSATESQADSARRRAGASEQTAGLGRERLTLDTKNVESQISNRGVMQDVAKRGAATAEKNAGTAAGNLEETKKAHKDLNEFRSNELKKVTPAQQNIAMDTALRSLGQDKDTAPYVKQTPSGFWEVNDEIDKNSAAYQVFKARLQQKLKSVLSNMTPTDDPTDHGIEIIPPPVRRR